MSAKKFPVHVLALYAVCSLTAMAGMNLGFLCVFMFFAITAVMKRKALPEDLQALPEFKSYLRFGCALFVACLLSLVVAQIFPVSYAGHAPIITLHGFLKIWYLFCPLIAVSVFARSPGRAVELLKIVNAWWLATAVLAVIAVIQFNTGWPLRQVIPTNPNHFHAILFFGHHLSTASIVIFPCFTALSSALGEYTRTKKIKIFPTVIGLCGLLILFLSYARTAWLAIPIGIVFVFARYLKPNTLVLSSLGLFGGLGALSQTPLLKSRIENSMGIQDRFRLWEANIDFFKHNPLTGIGWLKTAEMSEFYFQSIDPAHYRDYFWGHAHSNFFEMLGGTGLFGLCAFLAWSYFTLRLAYRTTRSAQKQAKPALADLSSGLGTGLVLLHFNGLTNVTFWEGKVMHQQMWAVAMLLMMQLILNRSTPAPGNAVSDFA